MAKREFYLNEQERETFQEAERKTRDAYELRRLQAVRLYGSGVATSGIMQVVNCSERIIRKWSQRYNASGLAGLKSQWQGENALKLSRQQRADLKNRLDQYRPDQVITPEIRISRGEFWTVSDLEIVVLQWYGVEYGTKDSYRALLKECRLSYQQSANIYRSRPDAQTIANFEAELEKK